MHHRTFKLWRSSHSARISSASTMVTILTPLLSLVSREARPPWTRSNMVQMVPVAVRCNSHLCFRCARPEAYAGCRFLTVVSHFTSWEPQAHGGSPAGAARGGRR